MEEYINPNQVYKTGGSLAKISKLEQLIDSTNLVAPIEYSNPDKDKEIFYDFVKKYAEHVDISIKEKTTTFSEDYKNYWKQFNLWWKYGKDTPWLRIGELYENAFRLVLGPIIYPIIGGAASITSFPDTLVISTPRYSGLCNIIGSLKTHEYMHAYHAIMAKDLREKGLIEMEGYHDVDRTEPPTIIKIPSHKKLKKYEKKVIKQMIKKMRNKKAF